MVTAVLKSELLFDYGFLLRRKLLFCSRTERRPELDFAVDTAARRKNIDFHLAGKVVNEVSLALVAGNARPVVVLALVLLRKFGKKLQRLHTAF